MFTGIIEQLGKVQTIEPLGRSSISLEIETGPNYALKLGDSIAVNGCCLTVTKMSDDRFWVDASTETMAVTNLKVLMVGQTVNLERAMMLSDRLGGHLVSGHIDGLAEIRALERGKDGFANLTVHIPKASRGLVVPKGSICLDGVSLTINKIEDRDVASVLEMTLIPETLSRTTFGELRPGWQLNFELDLIGKYLARMHTAKHS